MLMGRLGYTIMFAEHLFQTWVNITYSITLHPKVVENNKVDAARFAPFWNEIIRNLRGEDYVTNLLVMEMLYIFFLALFYLSSF